MCKTTRLNKEILPKGFKKDEGGIEMKTSYRKSILTLSIAEFYEHLTEDEYNEVLQIITKAGERKNKERMSQK